MKKLTFLGAIEGRGFVKRHVCIQEEGAGGVGVRTQNVFLERLFSKLSFDPWFRASTIGCLAMWS